jgi:bacterioferritin-associated ferredoxin
MAVTDAEVRRAVEEKGASSLEEVGRLTGAGTGCEACREGLRQLLEKLDASRSGGPGAAAGTDGGLEEGV